MDQDTSSKRPRPSVGVRLWHSLWRRRRWRHIRRVDQGIAGPNWAEITIMVLTAGMLLTAGVQAYIYWKEKGIMQQTLGQNERTIILGMGQLAVAGKNASTASDTLRESEGRFKDEERAWVGAIGVTDIVFEAGKPLSFEVLITNSGQTPALHLKFVAMAESQPKEQGIRFDYSKPKPEQIVSNFVLQPKENFFIVSGKPPSVATKAQVDAVTSGENWLWVYGKLSYEDVSYRPHNAHFCFIATPDLKGGMPCSVYNTAD